MKFAVREIATSFLRRSKRVREFHYTARMADGSEVEGTVAAKDTADAANQVLDMGLHPQEVRSGPGRREKVSVCDGVREGVVARWRLVRQDGHVAVWKPSRSGRLFGAVAACLGFAFLGGTWLFFFLSEDWGEVGTGWVIVVIKVGWWIGSIGLALMCLVFVAGGMVGLLQGGELRVDRKTGRLQLRRLGQPAYSSEMVKAIVVERRYCEFSSSGGDTGGGLSFLALVPTVRAFGKDDSVEVLEQCHSEGHAVALATKVAEYLNVPCRNAL